MCHTGGNGFPPGRVAPASLPPDEAGALVNRYMARRTPFDTSLAALLPPAVRNETFALG